VKNNILNVAKAIWLPIIATLGYMGFQFLSIYSLSIVGIVKSEATLVYSILSLLVVGILYFAWKPPAKHFRFSLSLLAWTMGLCILLHLLDRGINEAWFGLFPSEMNRPLTTADRPGPSLAVILIFILLLPIGEELFFRGILLRRPLMRGQFLVLSIIVSSIGFSALHLNFLFPMDYMAATINAFCYSIVASVLFARSESIVSVILLHIGYNSIAIFWDW
jgi:membrane protease YdiL (CAAX protease family)